MFRVTQTPRRTYVRMNIKWRKKAFPFFHTYRDQDQNYLYVTCKARVTRSIPHSASAPAKRGETWKSSSHKKQICVLYHISCFPDDFTLLWYQDVVRTMTFVVLSEPVWTVKVQSGRIRWNFTACSHKSLHSNSPPPPPRLSSWLNVWTSHPKWYQPNRKKSVFRSKMSMHEWIRASWQLQASKQSQTLHAFFHVLGQLLTRCLEMTFVIRLTKCFKVFFARGWIQSLLFSCPPGAGHLLTSFLGLCRGCFLRLRQVHHSRGK